MGNNTLCSPDNEQRAKFACALINKLGRQNIIVDADLTPLTDIASLITAFKAKITAVTTKRSDVEFLILALIQECVWLNKLNILTTTVITALTTLRGTSASTDLRFNFSQLVVSDPNF